MTRSYNDAISHMFILHGQYSSYASICDSVSLRMIMFIYEKSDEQVWSDYKAFAEARAQEKTVLRKVAHQRANEERRLANIRARQA